MDHLQKKRDRGLWADGSSAGASTREDEPAEALSAAKSPASPGTEPPFAGACGTGRPAGEPADTKDGPDKAENSLCPLEKEALPPDGGTKLSTEVPCSGGGAPLPNQPSPFSAGQAKDPLPPDDEKTPASDKESSLSPQPPAGRRCAPVRLILWGWGLLTAPNRLGEILRFCLVGGIATLIDFAVMAFTLWLFDPTAYPTLGDLFAGGDPSPLLSAAASALGFAAGHLFNYTASVRFVFSDSGRGRTKKGFAVFTLIALLCLVLHAAGMYACRALFALNEWLIKAVLTVLVTALSYVLKKKLLF